MINLVLENSDILTFKSKTKEKLTLSSIESSIIDIELTSPIIYLSGNYKSNIILNNSNTIFFNNNVFLNDCIFTLYNSNSLNSQFIFIGESINSKSYLKVNYDNNISLSSNIKGQNIILNLFPLNNTRNFKLFNNSNTPINLTTQQSGYLNIYGNINNLNLSKSTNINLQTNSSCFINNLYNLNESSFSSIICSQSLATKLTREYNFTLPIKSVFLNYTVGEYLKIPKAFGDINNLNFSVLLNNKFHRLKNSN